MAKIWIGTCITEGFVKKSMSFLHSLSKFHDLNFCVCYGFSPSVELTSKYKNVKFYTLPSGNYIDINGMIQWGIWLDALDYKYEDIYIMSDSDMLVQRSLNQAEIKRFLKYNENTVGGCINMDYNNSLKYEAISVRLKDGFKYNPAAQLINCGVMVARPAFFEKLTANMNLLIPEFNKYTDHRSRCQFLICHIIDMLNLKIDLLDRTFHVNGHFAKDPQECSFLNPTPSSRPERKLLYKKQMVMFSHHFERIHRKKH